MPGQLTAFAKHFLSDRNGNNLIEIPFGEKRESVFCLSAGI